MSDRSDGILTFGGAISRATLALIVRAMLDDGAGEDWEGAFEDEAQAIGRMEAVAHARRPFTICAHELAGGEFDSVPAVLMRAGVPFVSSWDAHHAYSAGAKAWRPGMDLPDELPADNEGQALIGLGTLIPALETDLVNELVDRMRLFDPLTLPRLVIEDARA